MPAQDPSPTPPRLADTAPGSTATERCGITPDGRIFQIARGGIIQDSADSAVWAEAGKKALTPEQSAELFEITVIGEALASPAGRLAGGVHRVPQPGPRSGPVDKTS
jgi:hypothetical protein